MDTTQMFSSERMNKQTVEHLHNGVLLSNKKQLNLDTLNILDELKGIMLSKEKKPISKGYIVYGSINMSPKVKKLQS